MWQIYFYMDRHGRTPVLDSIDNLSPRDRAKVNFALRLLEEFGISLGMPHARRIEGRLWELRPGDNRLFYCVFTGKSFIVLHCYRKQSRKTPETEIATARSRMKEVLEEEDVSRFKENL